MRNSDLSARIAAGIELFAIAINLFLAFIWFLSLVWVLVGVLWAGLGLVLLVEGAIAVVVLIRGYSPLGLAGPIVGMLCSLCNFNFFFGVSMEMVVLVLMIVAMVMRNQEDAAEAAS